MRSTSPAHLSAVYQYSILKTVFENLVQVIVYNIGGSPVPLFVKGLQVVLELHRLEECIT